MKESSAAQKRLLSLFPDLLLVSPFDEACLDVHEIQRKLVINILHSAGRLFDGSKLSIEEIIGTDQLTDGLCRLGIYHA